MDFYKRKEEREKVWNLFDKMLETRDPHPAPDLRSMIGKCFTRNQQQELIMHKRMYRIWKVEIME